MKSKHIKFEQQRGMTLMELLVGMAITTMIAMAALSVLTDFIKTRTQAAFSFELSSASEDVFNRITQDMHDSSDIKDVDPGTITFETNTGDIIYKLNTTTNRLERNNQPITSRDIKVVSFMPIIRSTDPVPLIEFNLELRNLDYRSQSLSSVDSTTISLRTNRGTP